MILRSILTISILVSSQAAFSQPSPLPVAQEVNTTTNNVFNGILLGQPAICLQKRLADEMAKKDATFDKVLATSREQDNVIKKQASKIEELENLVAATKLEITIRDNRDLLRKEYEDKLLDLVKKEKDKETSQWSRTTYFLLGDFAGILKGLGAALLYNKLVK